MGRDRKLFWRVMAPLAVTFALLWLGVSAMVISHACETLESRVTNLFSQARRYLEEQWEYYENNLDNGLGAKADWILQYNLSSYSSLLESMDGGTALAVQAGGKAVRSQIAYGYGHQEGVDQGQLDMG